MFVCIHAPDAGAQARNFSPWVEMADEKTAIFTLTTRQLSEIVAHRAVGQAPGLRRPLRPPAAIASTAEAAILAARNLPGFTFIHPGDEARILGPLPIDALPPDPEIFETLEMWGIRSLADFAQLPESGIAERMGARGLHLQRLARGALSRPLRPVIEPTRYEASAEMDHPIELREPLMFLLGRFLFDLTAKMKSQSLAGQALRITLDAQERTLNLPFPTIDLKFLMRLIEHSLERQPPEGPIERVHLEVIPTAPRRVQHGLFIHAAPEPERLALTLGKIRGLVGERNVSYPELFDTHRPGAGKPMHLFPAMAFRYFRPPLDAKVETQSGAPKHLWTKMFRGSVIQAAGPWRSSGDWWRPNASESPPWNRDEWDASLTDGALYRLLLDHTQEKWFVEGIYD